MHAGASRSKILFGANVNFGPKKLFLDFDRGQNMKNKEKNLKKLKKIGDFVNLIRGHWGHRGHTLTPLFTKDVDQ